MMGDEEIDDLYKILDKWTIDLEDIPDYNVKLAYLQFILQSAKECIMTNRNKIIYTDCKGRQDWHYSKSVGLGFVARDAAAKKKQETHQIMFKIIRNDQTIQNGKYLVDLKNIFARQLPKMPKQYIVKLVFDKHHESMVILKNGETVLGGISFRQFTEERFTQIAFLAITSTEQVKGFGTRLMNKLKQQMQKRKIQFLITYADNLALGYFKKQGFSKDSLMVQERWKGFIKDYQGGTMMQCKIHPTINYNLISDIIKKQKLFIVDKIKELSINKNKYKGQKIENMIKEPFLRLSSQGEHEYFKINPLQIPGIKQSGWNWEQHDEFIKSQQSSFAIQCQNIIDSLKRHPSSWPFRQPVSQEDVPDYYMIIKDPIDLKTIERKLNNQQYKNHNRFIEDIMAIFRNCRLYNQPQTLYYRHSNELQEFVKPLLQDLDRVDNGEIKEKRILFNKTSKKKNQKKQTRMDIQ